MLKNFGKQTAKKSVSVCFPTFFNTFPPIRWPASARAFLCPTRRPRRPCFHLDLISRPPRPFHRPDPIPVPYPSLPALYRPVFGLIGAFSI